MELTFLFGRHRKSPRSGSWSRPRHKRKDFLLTFALTPVIPWVFHFGWLENRVCGDRWVWVESLESVIVFSKIAFLPYPDRQSTLLTSFWTELRMAMNSPGSGFELSGAVLRAQWACVLPRGSMGPEPWIAGAQWVLVQLTSSTHQSFRFSSDKPAYVCKWILTYPFFSLQWNAKWRTVWYLQQNENSIILTTAKMYLCPFEHKLPRARKMSKVCFLSCDFFNKTWNIWKWNLFCTRQDSLQTSFSANSLEKKGPVFTFCIILTFYSFIQIISSVPQEYPSTPAAVKMYNEL